MRDHDDYWLLKEYLRITQEVHPEVFVIENVPQFLTANQGELLQKVMDSTPEYDVTANRGHGCGPWRIHTMRKRAILIGSRIGRICLPDLKVHPLPHRKGSAP